MRTAFFCALVLLAGTGMVWAQTGPNSPTSATNTGGIGVNAWSNAGNILASDNAHATVATRGITNYVVGTGFGFAIPTPSTIVGIQAQVEKSTLNPNNVALLNAWNTGLTRSLSAGVNRCLIVVHAQENGNNSRDITAMTYGGRSMTQVVEHVAGITNGFMARLEVWMLLESELALASGTAIVPTYGAYTPVEYCGVFSSAVFQHVDQLVPVTSQQVNGAQSSADPHQLATAITTLAGGMAINVATCGNRDASNPAPNTNTTSYATAAGYTEGTDHYFANATAAPNTGASLQVIHKAIATAGTEAPACNFNGTVNRWAVVGLHLQRARELDVAVHLVKGGAIGGSNLASPAAWGTTDGYTTYGGPTNLWGQTWTEADVNASNFGAALSAQVQNGTARVDHMRITVYSISTLPVELLDFRAVQDGLTVRLDWATATELNNDRFVVQRSADGLFFEDVVTVPGAGNSNVTLFYQARDEEPLPGTSYYRLRQVDFDGTMDHSPTLAVTRMAGELLVYPNPTTDGVLTIHDAPAGEHEVMVHASDMRLVRTARIAAGEPVLQLGDLPDGAYFIVVRNGSELRTTRVLKTSRSR